MEYNLTTLFQSVLLGLCILLVIALRKRIRLLPLTGFMTILALHMLHNILSEGYGLRLPHFTHFFSFLYGPLFYLFIYYLAYQFKGFKRKHLWHFVPAFVVFPIPFYSELLGRIVHLSVFVSLAIYLVLSFQTLSHVQKVLNDTKSNDLVTLNWLKKLLILLCLVAIFEVLGFLANMTGYHIRVDVMYLLTSLSLLFFASAITVKAIEQDDIFDGISKTDEILSIEIQNIEREGINREIRDINLTQATIDITETIEKSELYLDPNLSLRQLANNTGYSTRDVSYIINQSIGLNFNEFVNKYRIRLACQLLRTRETNHSIIDVVYKSGFNSKSSFYSAFKKLTGLTPKQFRENDQTIQESSTES